MTWLVFIAVVVLAMWLAMVVVRVERGVAEVRRHANKWNALAATQFKHETDIRYVRELVHPMARTGSAPWPEHLRQFVNPMARSGTAPLPKHLRQERP